MADKTKSPARKVTAKVVTKKRQTPKAVRVVITPFKLVGDYFIGAWRELREVRWTNRKNTWGLTFAVLLFSAAITIFVVLLDLALDWLTKRILL